MKVCSRCKTLKAEEGFYKDKRRADGLYPQCRSCASASKSASRRRGNNSGERAAIERWRKEHPDRVAAINRRTTFKRKYGITPEQYDEILASQGGVCAICGGGQPDGVRLAVDHCHDSSRVRGLLCIHCNTGIGHFRHDPDLLRKAIEYL